MQNRKAVIAGSCSIVLLVVLSVLINHRITQWVDGSRFQDMLGRETSKGLKLSGNYTPLHRQGLLGMRTDIFTGTNGYKTIVTLDAYNISGTFNPLGIFLRRWEIDSLQIQKGRVILQKTEPTPGAPKGAPWPPWWALFWPYRVHLADVKVDDADILWKLRDKESGIYGTRLEITPNGRDFEYDAHDGDFETPMTPPLTLAHAHVLIRKPRLYCSEFVLGDDPGHPEEQLRMSGDAGLQDDRSMHLQMTWTALKLAPWMPEKYRSHVDGQMNGYFNYSSSGTGLESGHGNGNLTIANGVLRELAPVEQYVKITGSPEPGEMKLKVCHADVHWDAGTLTADNIEVECDGIFRMTGTMTVNADRTLSGQIELGLTDCYLRWLPTAKTAIFTREEGPYHFTTVHFFGTAQKPQQDLIARVTHEVGKSPMVALKLFFNQAGEWLESN